MVVQGCAHRENNDKMNDLTALSGQLTSLREKLERRETELETLLADSATERMTAVQLIVRLSQACRGHDRELDNRLGRLRQRLDDQIPLTELGDDLLSVEKLLQQHANAMEESFRVARRVIEEGARYLGHSRDMPEKVRREARLFLTQEEPYGFAEHHRQVGKLLEIYQQAIRASLLQASPLVKPATSPNPAPHGRNNPLCDNELCDRLCDELQRLITELDFTGTIGDELAEIRSRLLSGVPLMELPELCLRMIELVIEGARHERHESHLFLSGINDSLVGLQMKVTASRDQGQELHVLHHRQHASAGDQIQQLNQQLNSATTLETLRESVKQHLLSMQPLLDARSQWLQRESQLLEAMGAIETRLNLLQEETSEYRKRLAQQNNRMLIDSLTQVFNRAAFDERVMLEIKRASRHQHKLCMAVVDVDFFKSINDRFGHLAGDKALKVIARAMSRALRETDFIARYGGEEFVVLLPGVDDESMLLPLEKLRQVVRAIPFRFKEDKVEITVSIGATLVRAGESATDAFERADRALYDAKHGGRDRIVAV